MWQPPAMPLVGLLVAPLEEIAGSFLTFNVVTTLALRSPRGRATSHCAAGWAASQVRSSVGSCMGSHRSWPRTVSAIPSTSARSSRHCSSSRSTELAVYRRSVWWKPAVGLGLLFAAQFLINQEGCAALAIATLVILGTLAAAVTLTKPGRRTGLVLRGGVVATGVAGVLLAGPLAVEFFGAQRLYGVLRPENTYVSDLANLVVASPVATEWAPGGTTAPSGAGTSHPPRWRCTWDRSCWRSSRSSSGAIGATSSCRSAQRWRW